MTAQERANWFRRYVIPALVFKAAVIGGAYSTGRELAQFFAPHGAWAGLLGMAAAMIVWSATYAVSLEFARCTRSYDYSSFFRNLIGPGAMMIDVLMAALLFLIVAVLGATAGEMFHSLVGAPLALGVALFTLSVAGVLLLGTRRIEMLLSYWSFVLYTFYVVFLLLALSHFGARVSNEFNTAPVAKLAPAIADGLRYAGYNIAAIAMVLFTARNCSTRREALVAGALGGPLAMLPGMLFFIAMMAFHPEIDDEVLPVYFLMERMGSPVLPKIYMTVVLVTLIGAAATVLHSLNNRIGAALETNGRSLPAAARFAVPAGVMFLSMIASVQFGLVELVARGYGWITFGFIVFFIVPILTLGVWRIWHAGAVPAVTTPVLK
jgi:uncharacterized membrane protein YkvI